MRLTTGYENRKARIELINLIDIAFIILIAFVYGAISLTCRRQKVALSGRLTRTAAAYVQIAPGPTTLWLDKEAATLCRKPRRRQGAAPAPC